MKRIHELRFAYGKTVYRSTQAPESIDEMDGYCPACGSEDYREIFTVVQHGFAEDDCVTVLSCADCFESFHYQYKIDSPVLLTPWPEAFS